MKVYVEGEEYTTLAKVIMISAVPIIVPHAYVACLIKGIRAAFRYAWLDAAMEIEVARKILRQK